MDLTVSRPVKILALVLVIAGVGGIASLQLLGKSSGAASGSAQLSVAQIRARAHGTSTTARTTAAPTPAKKHAVAPAKHAAPARPATTTTAPAAPAAPPKPKPTVAADGLPIALADALRQHPVVVVSIFDPQSQTDAVSYAEAQAGAGDAGAGFLGVSVLDDSVAGPLTAALPGGGLLPLPGLLVYRAPSTLVELIKGFADRDSVAALAVNAKTAPAYVAPASTTAAAPAPAPVVAAPPASDSSTTP